MSTTISSFKDARNHFASQVPKKLEDLKNGKSVSFEWEKSIQKVNSYLQWYFLGAAFSGATLAGVSFTAAVLNRHRLPIAVQLLFVGISSAVTAVDFFKAGKKLGEFSALIQEFLDVANKKQPLLSTFDVTRVTNLKLPSFFIFVSKFIFSQPYLWVRMIVTTAEKTLKPIGISSPSFYPLFNFFHVYQNADHQDLWNRMSAVSSNKLQLTLAVVHKRSLNALAIAIGRIGSQLSPENLKNLDDANVTALADRYKKYIKPADVEDSSKSILQDNEFDRISDSLLLSGKALLKATRVK